VVDQRTVAGLAAVLRQQREMQAMVDRITRPSRELQAMIDRATQPQRDIQAMIDRFTQPSRELQAMIDRATQPQRDIQAAISRLFDLSSLDVEDSWISSESFLAASTEAVRPIDAGSLLTEEAPAFLEDPARWLEEKEVASQEGDIQARQALLLIRHIYGCVLLFTRQLNPSLETVERYSRALSILVLFVIFSGTLASHSPSLHSSINNIFSNPSSLAGIILAVQGLRQPRPRRDKPSKMARRRNKPRQRTLLRRPNR
jgi:hypothetical protein